MGLWLSTPSGLTTPDPVTITSNAANALTVFGGVTSNGVFTSTRNENTISRHVLTNSNGGNGAAVLIDFANNLGVRGELGVASSTYTVPFLQDTFFVSGVGAGGVRIYSNAAVIHLMNNGQIGINTDAPIIGSVFDIVQPSGFGGFLVRPAAATGNGGVIVGAEDVASSATAIVLQQGGSSAAGTVYGLPNADLALIQLQNAANAIIATNNPIPLRFGTSGLERWQITADGELIPTGAFRDIGSTTNLVQAMWVSPTFGIGGYFLHNTATGNRTRWTMDSGVTGRGHYSFGSSPANAIPYLFFGPGIVGGNQHPSLGVGVEPSVGTGENNWGSAVPGAQLFLGRNTNGAGAPGCLTLRHKNGGNSSVWVDTAGDFRIRPNGSGPNASEADTIGTVVGTQTSTRDSKEAIEPRTDYDAMLAAVVGSPLFNWRYKSGSCGGQVFTGLTIDETPWSGMDPDDDHPHGRSFNPITVSGYLVGAIKALHARLGALEAR